MKISELKEHPVNKKIYGSENIENLKESIKHSGILVPLSVKTDGVIISGHRRYRAAKAIGLEDVPVITVDLEDELEERKAIIEHNRQRVKTLSQKMREAEEIEKIVKVEAEKRMKAGKKIDPTATLPEGDRGEARDEVSVAIGMKPRNFEKAKRIYKEASTNPEVKKLLDDVDAGEMSINKAHKEVKKQAIQKQKKEKAEQYTEPELTDKSYRVILADPPWKYNDKCEEGSIQSGGVEMRHYDTMSISELCEMQLPEIADDAVLFLWVTSPLLEDSFKVINAWGFKYKASFIWDKVKHNMGHYNSVRHELLLVCTRGSCTPDNKELFDSVQSVEKTKHSAKPPEFHEIIETLYTHGNKIELFARNKRKNWDTYGNEIN